MNLAREGRLGDANKALRVAASNGHLERVQWLLREGGANPADKDKAGYSALLLAASRGHLEVVRWLLHEGCASITEKNGSGLSIYLLAASNGHMELVQWLLREVQRHCDCPQVKHWDRVYHNRYN